MLTNELKEEIEELKSHLPDYLEQKGIDWRNQKKFLCLNPYHPDRDPSMVYFKGKNICHCFSCGDSPDLFTLIGYDYGYSKFVDQLKKARELFGKSKDYSKSYIPKVKKIIPVMRQEPKPEKLQDFSEYFEKCRENLLNEKYKDVIYKYISSRGLSWNTILYFGCGFDLYWKSPKAVAEGRKVPYSPRLIIPSGLNGYLARDIRSKEELSEEQKKWQKMKTGRMNIFNLPALFNDSAKVCFIVEGEIDAMSIWQSGCEAVGLGSVAMVKNFLNKIEEKGCKNILIPLLDNDEAGRKANEELERGLKELGVKVFHIDKLYDYGKDPNEALQNNANWFGAWVRHTKREAYYNFYPEEAAEKFMTNLNQQCSRNSNDDTYYFATASPKDNTSYFAHIEEVSKDKNDKVSYGYYAYEIKLDSVNKKINYTNLNNKNYNEKVVKILLNAIEKTENKLKQEAKQNGYNGFCS